MSDHGNQISGINLQRRNDEHKKDVAGLQKTKTEFKKNVLRYRLKLGTAYIACTDPTQWIEQGAVIVEVLQDNGKRKRGRPKKISTTKKK